MLVSWVMMSKHLALPGQQLGSRVTNEGVGLHLGPGNKLMQLSITALMTMEIMKSAQRNKTLMGELNPS